jgi:hypothetical protein
MGLSMGMVNWNAGTVANGTYPFDGGPIRKEEELDINVQKKLDIEGICTRRSIYCNIFFVCSTRSTTLFWHTTHRDRFVV